MARFLIFRLYGPMAAWGDIAVGEERPTSLQPSRSAILGLAAAALGIRRHEEERHAALSKGYGFAVRVDAHGSPLRDFHTIQKIASSARLKHLYSRRDELGDRHNRYTMLSRRDYRCDGLYTICLHRRNTTIDPTPEAIAAALKRPRLPLYLGRKSCPLSLPLDPRVIEATGFETAMRRYDSEQAESNLLAELTRDETRQDSSALDYFWDADVPTALPPLDSIPRHDQPVSRTRRQFAARTEHHVRDREA